MFFDEANGPPAEFQIECVLELIVNIGYTLELLSSQSEKAQGNQSDRIATYMSTLAFLKIHVDGSTGKQTYSKRIQFAIQDVLDLRKNSWRKKVYKERAKQKHDIDYREHAVNYNPTKVEFAEEVAGQRPEYIDDIRFKQLAARDARQKGEVTCSDAEIARHQTYYDETKAQGEGRSDPEKAEYLKQAQDEIKQAWASYVYDPEVIAKSLKFLVMNNLEKPDKY